MKRYLAVILIPILTLLILSGACAPLHKHAPLEQLTISEAQKIISGIKDQSDSIRSFYSLGVISIKGRMLGSDADILIAGIRDPFALKIEITHSWGKPVLHILIREGRLNVLSYQEKLGYSGTFSPEALSKFLPGFDLDQGMIWSILSGRPPVVSHEVVAVSGSDMISLRSGDGIELEAINLPFGASFPEKITLPVQSLDVYFSGVKEGSGVPYAGDVRLSGKRLEKDLALKINRMTFNTSVPDQIFTMQIPSDWETVNLDALPGDEDK